MKQTLDHLPEQKQTEIRYAAKVIQEEVAPEMIILFGSYARGDWVEELGPDEYYYLYQSDIDLLVVMESGYAALKVEGNDSLWQRLRREVKTPISFIAHDITFLNKRLCKGQYFFTDIQQEGVLLHDTGTLELAEAKALSPKERKKLADEDFEYWFESAKGFLRPINLMWEKVN